MTDLKYMTLEELYESKESCDSYIEKLKSTLNGQRSRKEWIESYIFKLTPKEMTMHEIETELGHRVILK